MIRVEHAFLVSMVMAAVTMVCLAIADSRLRRENQSLRQKLHELADALRKLGEDR